MRHVRSFYSEVRNRTGWDETGGSGAGNGDITEGGPVMIHIHLSDTSSEGGGRPQPLLSSHG